MIVPERNWPGGSELRRPRLDLPVRDANPRLHVALASLWPTAPNPPRKMAQSGLPARRRGFCRPICWLWLCLGLGLEL